MRIKFEALEGNLSRAPVRACETGSAAWIWFSVDTPEQAFVIQEKFGGQNALPIESLKQIAGRD